MVSVIANGIPQTEMVPQKDLLTEQQIWQLVTYIRLQAGSLKPKPFVADPDGQIVKSEKQTLRIEVVARDIETPWGLAFLPDGRLLITERPGRLRILEKGKLLPPVSGTPKVWERQDGGLFDVEVHPQYAKNGWIYLAYSETVPNYVPPADKPDAAPPANPGGRGGNQPPSIPSMTVVVRGKINATKRVGRAAGPLPRRPGALHHQQLALRIAVHLRSSGASLLHHRRARRPGERAGPDEPARQDPPRQ